MKMGLIPLLPDMDNCCFCIPNIRVAAAIIAVLGIVTSPSVAWAIVKHAYSLKVSCIVSTNSPSAEIVDLNLQHILSFGFGANAGVGTSCFGTMNKTAAQGRERAFLRAIEKSTSTAFISTIKYFGWLALVVDIAFVCICIQLLFNVFKTECRKIALVFMIVAMINIVLSFAYALFYIAACIKVGSTFPVFELIFAFMDLGMWFYFICVINTFAQGEVQVAAPRTP